MLICFITKKNLEDKAPKVILNDLQNLSLYLTPYLKNFIPGRADLINVFKDVYTHDGPQDHGLRKTVCGGGVASWVT